MLRLFQFFNQLILADYLKVHEILRVLKTISGLLQHLFVNRFDLFYICSLLMRPPGKIPYNPQSLLVMIDLKALQCLLQLICLIFSIAIQFHLVKHAFEAFGLLAHVVVFNQVDQLACRHSGK